MPWPIWSRTCRPAPTCRAPRCSPCCARRWPTGRAEIRRRFEEPGPLKNDGPAVLAATSFLMDQLIRVIFDFADSRAYPAANPSAAERLGVVATGGFGRGEMAPLQRHRSAVPAALQADAARRADRRVHALPAVGPRAEGRPRHAHGRGEPALRRARPDHPHRAARGALHLGRPRAVRRAGEGLRRRSSPPATAATSSRPSSPSATSATQRMGDSRYVVEPNVKEGKGGLRDLHTLFWIAKYLYRVSKPAELVDKGVLTKRRGAPFRARRALPHHGALPHPLSHRPRRRPPVLRPPARDRHASRLPGPAGQPRRRALHEALLSSCQDGRRPHAHLRRRARGQPPAQAQARRAVADACGRASSTASASTASGWRAATPDAFDKDPVAILRLFHVAQENELDIHPATLAADHPEHPPGRPAAQRSRGQSPVHGDADLAPRSGDDPAASQRGRRVRPLRARLRPRRRADAARHVPHLHRRRAHHPRHRHPGAHRERHAEGRPSAVGRGRAQHPVAAGALSRGAAARHRQGPRRRSLGARRRGRDAARPAAWPERRRDRDRGLAGALPPRHVGAPRSSAT